jgi:hypothetical protein
MGIATVGLSPVVDEVKGLAKGGGSDTLTVSQIAPRQIF